MLKSTTDINNNINPTVSVPMAINPEGTEKYLVSLKIVIIVAPKTIPIIMNISPGIPRNFSGCFIAINSTIEVVTSKECEIGFLVDVGFPVLYMTVIFSSEIFKPLFAASIKI